MMDTIGLLMSFGLTQQEAKLYENLYGSGQNTGYELAKLTGISRSNAYAGLASLVEKGGAYLLEGKPVRYEAVPVREFCQNAIRALHTAADELEHALPRGEERESGYATIRGERHIRDKIHTMLQSTQYRVYLSMPADLLGEFLPRLQEMAQHGKKVVVIADREVPLEGGTVYRAALQPCVIRVIADSRVALTGELDNTPGCTCLYSLKKNLVNLLKDSVKNEIRLIELSGL